MHVPSTAELLNVWEEGLPHSPERRSLLLLAAACVEFSPDQLLQLTAGQRDARLLALRERLLGPLLTCLDRCPACGELLEVQFSLADVQVDPGSVDPAALTATADGFEVLFRLPTCQDLAQLDASADTEVNRRRLLDACVLQARHAGEGVPPGRLEGAIVDAIDDAMARADPQAGEQVEMHCPQCAHEWRTPFEIGPFLWSEIHAWAQRLLGEIHALALAYGWREADILALSPWRRQAYLDLIAP